MHWSDSTDNNFMDYVLNITCRHATKSWGKVNVGEFNSAGTVVPLLVIL